MRGIPSEFQRLEAQYRDSEHNLTVSASVQVGSLDFLLHNRSVLDYIAHEIAKICIQQPNKIYFPIAPTLMKGNDFRKRLDDKYLPGLANRSPQIFGYLDSIQHYYGNEWLPIFGVITNKHKHCHLELQEREDCEALVVMSTETGRGFQIGDRGLKWVELQAGGTLRFSVPSGRNLEIRGPQRIDVTTTSLVDADPGIELVRHKWREIKFHDFPVQPAICFLNVVQQQVRGIANTLVDLLGMKHEQLWPALPTNS
jgi:hypothetical protein